MLIYKLKFIGSEATMVRTERGGEKRLVKPEEVIDCQDKQAKSLLQAYPNLFAPMGTQIDEDAMAEKREKAQAAQLKLSERQALADKKLAEKKNAEAADAQTPADETILTYESVMGMDMVALAQVNDSRKLGVKITKKSQLETVRGSVALALDLAPALNDKELDLETFKAMIDNRTPEQLLELVADLELAVENIGSEEDREEAKEYLVNKNNEVNPSTTGKDVE